MFEIGGTKKAEYIRSLEIMDEIYKEKGLYFILAFLYDTGYDRKDIREMMKIQLNILNAKRIKNNG